MCRLIVLDSEEERINEINEKNKENENKLNINTNNISYNYVDYIEFDESVYNVEWSNDDQWYFGSITYNGTFHINKVPDDLKFKIMID